MREDDWGRTNLHRLHARPVARVGAVDDHPHPVHFLNDLDAETAQSGIGTLGATVANSILAIIGEQHVTTAAVVVKANHLEIALEGIGFL